MPDHSSQAAQLSSLLAALEGVPLTADERSTLEWLAGQSRFTVETIVGVIQRSRGTRQPPDGG